MRNEYGAEIIWAPFDLHPEYPPEGVPRPPSTGEMEARFAENGLVYDPPPIRANSLKALRLAEHARAEGLFDPMHARLMDAYWAEAQNIGDPDVLRALAEERRPRRSRPRSSRATPISMSSTPPRHRPSRPASPGSPPSCSTSGCSSSARTHVRLSSAPSPS